LSPVVTTLVVSTRFRWFFFSFGLPRFDFDLTTVLAAVFFKPDNFFFVFCRTFAIQSTSIGANTLQCGKVPFCDNSSSQLPSQKSKSL
jgi:hypothetical protein